MLFDAQKARIKQMLNDATESQIDALRFGGIALALALIGFGGYWFFRPKVTSWQHEQALKQADELAQNRDYRGMLVALQRATQLAPNDVATWREVARRLDELGAPESLVARENLVRLAPAEASYRLALVKDALKFGEPDRAQLALTGITEAARTDAAFHRLTAAVALALGKTDEIESALASLVQVAPDDAVARFNLAAVRLWSVDAEKSIRAVAELETLTEQPTVRVRAAVELLKFAARQSDAQWTARVVTLALQRLSPPGANPLPTGNPPGWFQLIEALKSASVAQPGDAAVVAGWMGDVGMRREALGWLEALPPAQNAAPEVLSVALQLSASLSDVSRVEPLLRRGAWGALPPDAVTLAVASQVQAQRQRGENARATWDDAVAACGTDKDALRTLARLAAAWRDPIGIEHALLAVIARYPNARWAFEALRNGYAERADLPGMVRLYDKWVEAEPHNDALARDWVILSCVIDHLNEGAAQRAEQLYSTQPKDRSMIIALAAVRWKQGRVGDAVGLLNTLEADSRTRPDAAFWDALAQAEYGDKSAAAQAVSRAWRPDLPTEQLRLLQEAARKSDVNLPRVGDSR